MEGTKKPPTSFSSVTSTNVGISPQNFLILVLTLLPHLCEISSPYLMPSYIIELGAKSIPQKNWFFWSNPYKIEVMITSLIEMLELAHFGYMTTSTI